METTQGIYLNSYLKLAKTPRFLYYLLLFFFYKIEQQEGGTGSAWLCVVCEESGMGWGR
jgi:hypothetical protein